MTTNTNTSLSPGHRWREAEHAGFRYRWTGKLECLASGEWAEVKSILPQNAPFVADLMTTPTEPIPEPPVVRDEAWEQAQRLVERVWEMSRGGKHPKWEGISTITDRIVRLLRQPTPTLTMQGHVDALVGMGAFVQPGVIEMRAFKWTHAIVYANPRSVLILPTPEGA